MIPQIDNHSVSAYLIPARGLKLLPKHWRQEFSRSFRISNPRKGTETQSFKFLVEPGTSFRISNPRKGTETWEDFKSRNLNPVAKVSAYLIPARGLKPGSSPRQTYICIVVSAYLIPARGLKPDRLSLV